MRLGVSPGWAVTYYQFEDVDPDIDGNEIVNWEYYKTSLAQFHKMELVDGQYQILEEHLLIDLGWYPEGEPDGAFHLVLAKMTPEGSWDELKQFKSQDRFSIRDKIEEWMKIF